MADAVDVTTDLGLVRMYSRDMDSTAYINSDDELNALLGDWSGNILLSAAWAVRLMAGDAAKVAKVQRFSSFTIGAGSTLYQALLAYAAQLEQAAANQTTPVTSGSQAILVSSVDIVDNTRRYPYPQYSILNYDAEPAHKW